MADDMKELRRKRVATESEAVAETPAKKTKKRKYLVKPHHKICIEKDVYKRGGDIIVLGKDMAQHFMKHGCIEPYVNLDDDD